MYPEVFGQLPDKRYRQGEIPGTYEGTQYEYYINNRKIKYFNDNGVPLYNGVEFRSEWWAIRSPSSHEPIYEPDAIYYWIMLSEDPEFDPYHDDNSNAYSLDNTIQEPYVYDSYISISPALAL